MYTPTLGALKAIDNGYANSLSDYALNHFIPAFEYAQIYPTMNQGLSTFKNVLFGFNTLATLGNIWMGFKNYKLAKNQLALAQDQWNTTKQELNHIRTLRDKLTKEYINGE